MRRHCQPRDWTGEKMFLARVYGQCVPTRSLSAGNANRGHHRVKETRTDTAAASGIPIGRSSNLHA